MNFAMYWDATDAVSRSLFFILLALSVASWVVGIIRLVQSKKMAGDIAQALHSHMDEQQSALHHLEFNQKKTAVEQLLLQQIARYRFDSEKGLPILGTTAAIAPFIGLFGTVWGVFHALHSIGESGQAGLAQVAAPVGEALIMTGLGLAVAIPAVIFYNIITRLNRKTLHVAHDTAYAILAKVAL